MLPYDEKALLFKAFGYEPNPIQLQIHKSQKRIVQVAGGERAGKSKVGGEEMSAEAAADPGLYWIVGPDYFQARAEFFYCVENLQRIDAIADLSIPKEGQCQLMLRGGCQIQTKSGEDAVKLASFAPKGILMVEAAQQTLENFQKLANRTAENRAWLKATGTFESSLGWYAEMFEELQNPNNVWGGESFSLPTWANLAVYPGGEKDPEILRLKATNTPDMFLERFGGIPCPPRGLVFREFKYRDHVIPIRYTEIDAPTRDDEGWRLPADTRIELWVDPGYAGAYAVLFVALDGKRAYVLDEVYARGVVGEQVIMATMQKGDLFQRVIHHQRRNGLGGVIDIAARQHAGMESHEELWRRMAGIVFRAQPVPIADGISRTRTFLRDPMTEVPRIFFDPKCTGTIKEFGLYKYRDESPNRANSELPIDKDNHSMKAIAYGLTANFGFVDGARTAPMAQRPSSAYEQVIETAYQRAQRRGKETGWLA